MNSRIDEALAALRQQFTQQLEERLDSIRKQLQRIDPATAMPADIDVLYRLVHTLNGSAGTFGMNIVSDVARDMEACLAAIIRLGKPPGSKDWQEVLQAMDKLENVSRIQLASNAATLQSPAPRLAAPEQLIYLVEDDAEQASFLAHGLIQEGYKVRTFPALAEFIDARTSADGEQPAAIVMDMIFQEGGTAGADIVSQLRSSQGKCPPLVFVSVRDDMAARLAAYRAGGNCYLTKPVDPKKLAHLLDGLTGRMPPDPYRILLVDDDNLLLAAHASMLRKAGMVVETLDQPLQALDLINEFKPDVLVLDVYMPELSGPELAAILREKEELANLPILFLSAEQDLGKQLLALNLGGDDFLVKPVQAEYFAAAVTARARRGRQHDEMMRRLKLSLYEREREHLALNQHAIVSIADRAGNIIYVNDKFCEISGYAPDELLGHNHRIIKSDVHPPEFYQTLWRTIASGQVWHGEVCNRRKDGSYYWVESTITPFLDGDGKPYQYVSIRTDITRGKLVEIELEKQEERLRRGQAFANIGTWDWNIATGELFWTERIAPLFGYPVGELETSYANFINAVHPDDRQLLNDAVTACIERDVPYEIEHRVVWPDGTVRWLMERGAVRRDASGKPIQMLGVVQDIDRRKRTELALAESRARLVFTQALAKLGYWTVDMKTGEAVWSEELYILFGRDPATYKPTLNSYYQDVVHPDDVQALRQAEQETYASGKRNKLDHRIVHTDGSVRWVHIEGEAERDAAGQIIRLNGSVQDITERKQAELALLEREQQLREAQNMAHIGNWQADMLSGTLSWSDEIYRIFGHEPGSFVPTVDAFKRAVHPEDVERVNESERRAAQSGIHDVVHRIVRPDGTLRHVHELARAERNAAGQVVRLLGTVQDVTERVEAEARLRETEERFHFAVEGAGDGIWDWNMLTGEMLLSGNYEPMLGYVKGELEQTIEAWIKSVHPDDLQRIQQILQEYLEGKLATYEVELRLRCKKSGYKWVLCRGTVARRDATGKPVRMIGIHSDIQQRKLAEDRLALFGHIFDASQQAIGITDGEGKILYMNPAHQQLHGYTLEEMLGKPFMVFLSDSSMAVNAGLADALAHGGSWNGLLTQRHKDGSLFVTSNSVGSILDEHGKPRYMFNIMYDYTQELERQQELSVARDNAERANQAKSEFLSSMSHELRTPMNAILGFAQMLEYDDTLNPDQQDNVHEILKAGHHLLELINEVLDLAKIESGRIDFSIEPVELGGLFEDCRNLVQPLASARSIDMHIDVQRGAAVRADRVRLKQVLLNLLSNAVKYNREKGSIRLEVQPAAEGRLRISVADTGPGIVPERMAELFQPFSRLDAEGGEIEGTGIGLTITRRLVELMGGEIGVNSQPGKGTTFWIDFPVDSVASAEVAAGEGADGSAAATTGTEHRVLCIDDNPVNLKLVAQMLGKRKHIHLLTAHTPQLGLELAMAHHPELILLDINMPGMDGYQVLEVLKAEPRLQNIPVVAVTANAMPRDIERGMAAGFTAYLTKPLNVTKFLQTVDACLELK